MDNNFKVTYGCFGGCFGFYIYYKGDCILKFSSSEFNEERLNDIGNFILENSEKMVERKEQVLEENEFKAFKYGDEYVKHDWGYGSEFLTTTDIRKAVNSFGVKLSYLDLIKILINEGYLSDSMLDDNPPLDKYSLGNSDVGFHNFIKKKSAYKYEFGYEIYAEILDKIYSIYGITDEVIKSKLKEK